MASHAHDDGDTGMKRLSLVLAAMTLALAWTGYAWLSLVIRVAHAEAQVKTFYGVLDEYGRSGAVKRAEAWEYIRDYYPSGTKQPRGTRLDRLVEAVREDAMRRLSADGESMWKGDLQGEQSGQ